MTSTHPNSIGSWSHLKNPELIVPEAFVEHPQRIQRQIAAATDTPLCAVVAAFEELCPESSSSTGEGEKPYAAITLCDYAAAVDCSIYVYDGQRLLHAAQRENHKKEGPGYQRLE